MSQPAATPVKLRNGTVKGQIANQSAAHRQDHAEEAFAPLRQNNKVECFTTGKAYFNAVSAAMKKAKKSIFIAGWQVNWDLELAPEDAPGERLIDILHERVHSSPDLRVYVMPWMSPKVGVNTFDLGTMLAIFQLNAGRKTMQAMCCPAGAQSDYVGTEGAAFSHHQKFVVIDNETAFVGGMDLAYGRYDDATFSLDPGTRRFNERYNPGVTGAQECTADDGATLSAIDLMSTTLTAGYWNAGGDSGPSAIVKALREASHLAESTTLEAVRLVNMASKSRLDAINAANNGLKKVSDFTRDSAHRLAVSADVAVAAANAVSRQCAMLQIPDMYGAVKAQKVGGAATSTLPATLRQTETAVRHGYNESIDAAAHFLSPLTVLRVRPTPQSALPQAVKLGEVGGRAVLNTMIDIGAALVGLQQQATENQRTACVEFGPALQSGVAGAKVAAHGAVHQSRAAVAAARDTVNRINSVQLAILSEINNVRAAVNKQALTAIANAWDDTKAMGNNAADFGLNHLTQAGIQDVLDSLMHLCKKFYVAQLGIDWQRMSAHPLLLAKSAKAKSTKAAAIGGVMLGKTQPRQPWQDVQVQIEGGAVFDLAMNFIGRWNACHNSYVSAATFDEMNILGNTTVAAWYAGHVRDQVLFKLENMPAQPPTAKPAKPTGVAVRVLRSAPLKLCKQEALADVSPDRKDKITPESEQHEIETQMVNLINNATDFVYIENQFYQSEFGNASIDVFARAGDSLASGPIKSMMEGRMNKTKVILSSVDFAPGTRRLPKNKVNAALGDRIAQAVRRDQPFHVYLVLPVHPEGPLNDITIAGQVHWTMQSIVFADFSLVNRVRRAIAARQLCKNTLSDAAWNQAMKDAGKSNGKQAPYQKVEEKQWCKYLTLLNLRNCQTVGGVVRTEQIYIHSKLLIVDDRHVILGSANINDRSLNGKRDSELAVMLFDTAEEKKTIRDRVTTVNTLARELRVNLWKKHFAITGGGNEIVKPADAMEALIERPAADETIAAIQKIALDNANIYTDTFPHVPWTKTSIKQVQTGASIWPVCPSNTSAENARIGSAKMPFHDDFWKKNAPRVNAPGGIKGYLTKLATNWTIGENNHPGQMSVMALTMLEKSNETLTQPGEPTAPAQGIA
jgi:phosphatidylserine/phosphatidylglycerophosphate/cardiolipin synthase-like enzyme